MSRTRILPHFAVLVFLSAPIGPLCGQSSTSAGASVAGLSDSTALAIKIFRVPGDEPGFELNRAAYVAVFEVRPGEGVAQLYPDNTEGSRVTSPKGRTFLLSGRVHYNRQSSQSQNNYAPTASSGTDRLRTSRTILVVASDRPLRVGAPTSTGNVLRRIERLRSLRSGRVAIDDLLAIIEAVRPEDPGAELATDTLEVPPS